MKKTMKKYVSLLLALMMLVTSVVFNAGAAECMHQFDFNSPENKRVVSPTCTEQGYTEYKCLLCGAYASKGDIKDAYGHLYDKFDFVAVGDEYNKVYTCTRQYLKDGQTVTCNDKITESESGQPVVYYRVDFYNNKVSKNYDKTINYTNVAVAPYETEWLYTDYVKKGEAAIYAGINLVREKTKEFPLYIHPGWSESNNLEATRENNLSEADTMDLSSIDRNLVLYPVFEGITSTTNGIYTYDVLLYIINQETGNLIPGTKPQPVAHGDSPKYSDPNGVMYPEPVKPEDIVNTYKFKGWATTTTDKTNLVTYEGIEEFKVYGDVCLYPIFDAVPKNYTVEFYNYNGKTRLTYPVYEKNADGSIKYEDGEPVVAERKDATFTGINLQKNLLTNEAIAALNKDDVATAKPSDYEYIYEWTGEWAVMSEGGTPGRTVDLNYLQVTGSELFTVDDNPEKVIRLMPVYKKLRKTYAVDIIMAVPSSEDPDYYRGEADVHVVANNGQLVASGKTNEHGIFRCYLYYQLPFTVTVATQDEKYLGEAQINFLEKAIDPDKEASINSCTVNMQMNPDYETHCRCIHHNPLIQPIWVRILNILYSLFNVKYVCCYDMYSTIGPLLQYTR